MNVRTIMIRPAITVGMAMRVVAVGMRSTFADTLIVGPHSWRAATRGSKRARACEGVRLLTFACIIVVVILAMIAGS